MDNSEDAAAARAAEQARLRKERREAKIKAGGTSRLKKITGLGGGFQREQAAQQSAPAPSGDVPPAAVSSQHADPDEVDISQHYYAPQTTSRIPPFPANPPVIDPNNMSDATLRQLMLGMDPQGAGGPGMGRIPGGMEDDPMMRMMMQMMGGAGGGGGGGPGGPFGGMGMPQMPGQPQAQQQQAALPSRYTALWRLVHTLVALGLGLYIAAWTSFGGTKLEREHATVGRASVDESAADAAATAELDMARQRFVWSFATAEAVLLTTRFFVDRGRKGASSPGLVGMLVGFLPHPARGYVETAMWYFSILGTVRADVLACVFVLGACSWWRG